MFRLPEIGESFDRNPLLGMEYVAPDHVAPEDVAPEDRAMSSTRHVQLEHWQAPLENPEKMSAELKYMHDIIMNMHSPDSSPTLAPDAAEHAVQPSTFMLPPSMEDEHCGLSTAAVPVLLPPAKRAELGVLTCPESTGPPRYKPKSRKVAQLSIEVDAGACDVSAQGVTRKPHFLCTVAPIDDKLHEHDFEMQKAKKVEEDSRMRLLQSISREAREAAYHQRRTGFDDSSAHDGKWRTNRERGDTWAQLRYYQIQHLSRLLLTESGIRGGFLTKDMHKTVGNLAALAVNQVVRTPNNRMLHTASAPFWTFALAQEAWRRRPGNEGWSTDCPDAACGLSWDGMEALYHGSKHREALKGAETHEEESNRELSATDVLRGRKQVVVCRKVVSHGLGHSHGEVIKKMQCLHELLVAAGDTLDGGEPGGLHPDIRSLMAPVVNRFPKPDPTLVCLSNSKAKCIARHRAFGTKKPTTAEQKDLAEAAASVATMDTDD